METFLTCRKIAELLRENSLEEEIGNVFEEAALKAVYRTLSANLTFGDIELLLSELPKILPLHYSIVKNISAACENLIPQLLLMLRNSVGNNYSWKIWNKYARLNNSLNFLKAFN